MAACEEFFSMNKPPSNFEEMKEKMSNFCALHRDEKIVLVTSGGTTIPLEHNTVRFVDNFSAGTRGSASAEYFIGAGYNVIFLYRLKSLEPFVRHFTGRSFLDKLVIKEESKMFCPESSDIIDELPKIEVSSEYSPELLSVLRKYQVAVEMKSLLFIDFTTLSDYLWLLREASSQLACHGIKAMLYLAAAVSDFYIPAQEIPEHKMQSANGAPSIQLQLVPKMLEPLVSNWAPEAFVVSFKLETDPEILIVKARKALETYKHKLVIGNILSTRKTKVTVIERLSEYEIIMTDEEVELGMEIEEKIVFDLLRRHTSQINYASV